ncbi:hypothetical protein PSPO01_11898 [Paraphaeosphaeria sporulosa]
MLDGVFFTTKETNFFFQSLHRPVQSSTTPTSCGRPPKERSSRRSSRSSGSRDYPFMSDFPSFFCKSMWFWGYLFALFELPFPTFSAAMSTQTHGLSHVPRSFATYTFNVLDSRSHRLTYVMGQVA